MTQYVMRVIVNCLQMNNIPPTGEWVLFATLPEPNCKAPFVMQTKPHIYWPVVDQSNSAPCNKKYYILFVHPLVYNE